MYYCYMLAKDNLPINTVEKEGFKEFVKSLNPHYKLPCRNTTTALVEEKYNTLSTKIKNILSNISDLSLTTDVWTESYTCKSFLGLTVHFIQKNECKTIMIGVKELDDRHTSDNLKEWLMNMLNQWEITPDKIVAIITDNAANIVKAVNTAFPQKHLPCFAHTLNLIPSRIIDEDEYINPIIKKVKRFVTFVKTSVEASDILRAQSKLKVIQSVDTRWNSTYEMLKRFIELLDIISIISLRCRQAPPMLNASEVEAVNEFIDLLHPFEEATKFICGEKYITGSKTIPIVNILRNKLKSFSPESESAKRLLKGLSEQFHKRFDNIEGHHLLSIATILDPKFKKLHFDNKVLCSKAVDKISKMIMLETADQKKTAPADKNPTAENNFWEYHNELLQKDNLCKESRSEQGLADALKYYLNQPNISMNDDPVAFWNKNSDSALYKLAKRYLSIVATSVPAERLFSKAGRISSRDRSKLTGEHLDQLLFLSSLSREDWSSFD